MAQLERPQRHGEAEATTPTEQRKLSFTATMEHYLRGTEASRSSLSSSPFGSHHDAEEHHEHHPKKSVLTKVKEKAKKLKHSLSNVNKKKHHDNDSHETDNTTPSWRDQLKDDDEEEEEEEDAEYLGAPMYKSETAPEGYKETAKRAITPVLLSSGSHSSEQNNELKSPSSSRIVAESVITKLPNEIFTGIVLTRTLSSKETTTDTTDTKPQSPKTVSLANSPMMLHSPSKAVTETRATNTPSPQKTITETVTTDTSNHKNTITETGTIYTFSPKNKITETGATNTSSPRKTITESVTEKLGAGYATVSEKLGTGYATVSEMIGIGYATASEKIGTGYAAASEKLGTGYNAASEKLGTGYNAASEKLGTGYNAESEKFGPAYATVTDATHAIASKIESLTVSAPCPTRRENLIASRPDPSKIEGLTITTPPPSQRIPAQEAPQALSASAAEHNSMTRVSLQDPQPSSAPVAPGKTAEQRWDKGVSVKEYLIHKFEPGEDERALSQVISDAISPRKGPGEAGVVEKVKGAITSLLRNEDSPRSNTISQSPLSQLQPALSQEQSALNTSSPIPFSTNAYEVIEEENQGRILQAN